MAEFDRDAEDRLFESLLASEPLADKGFSERVLRRLRRRLWLRRLCLPVAAAIGASIALPPLVRLAGGLRGIAEQGLTALLASGPELPPLPLLVGGAALLLIWGAAFQLLED